jgi:hypothetical protein
MPAYVVQPQAYGPQHAVNLALNMVKSEHVMLLMGDNFVTGNLADLPVHTGVSIVLSEDTALHSLFAGRFVHESQLKNGTPTRWLGPLIFRPRDWYFGDDWVQCFKNAPAFTYFSCEAEDMGVL